METFSKTSLFDTFNIPVPTHQEISAQLQKISKVRAVTKAPKYEEMGLTEKLKVIKKSVYKVLGRYRGFIRVIYNVDDLNKYIDKAIKCGFIAFDTETNNSLDPLTCKLMGLCLYVPNTKPVYVPINHCIPGTETLLKNQVTEEEATLALQRLHEHKTKVIYHNGKFDIRVIYNTLGFYMPIWWDTMLAAQMIDENSRAGLKNQFKMNINPTIDTYSIDKLFKGVPYAWVDPEIFALYAAIDAFDTYKLQQWQYKYFMQDGMDRLYNVFSNIEVPVTLIVAQMEDSGVAMDLDFVERLNKKYHKGLDNALKEIDEILKPYSNIIELYQADGRLDNPLNFNSTPQLQMIVYDILKVEPVEEGSRATDANTLQSLDHPFVKSLLTYRHFTKLITAFTESLPKLCSPRDGKIHASFNQMGKEENNVRTGRFSSTDPNLQQIPSREKIMRMMFTGSDDYKDVKIKDSKIVIRDYSEVETTNGFKYARDLKIGDTLNIYNNDILTCTNIINIDYERTKLTITLNCDNGIIKTYTNYVIIGGDFSQQEPRLLTHMCKDPKLIETYNNKKDLYATIAASVFKKDYWECMEKWEDGSPNPTGKGIRSKAKGIVLGVMYGMGPKLMASILKVDVDECKKILDDFYEMFPTVKAFTEGNVENAKQYGFVEDYMGRRRHLPDILLPEISIKAYSQHLVDTSCLLDFDTDKVVLDVLDKNLEQEWLNDYKTNYSRNFDAKVLFKEKAKNTAGCKIDVLDNGAFISKTMTQCTNARIQGSAATLTKKAMIEIANDERLQDIGFKILIPVHDELLGECPVMYADECEGLLSDAMIRSGKPECSVNMKCDTYCLKHWYSDEVSYGIHEKYTQLISGDEKKGIEPISEADALAKIYEEHSELSFETVEAMAKNTYDYFSSKL